MQLDRRSRAPKKVGRVGRRHAAGWTALEKVGRVGAAARVVHGAPEKVGMVGVVEGASRWRERGSRGGGLDRGRREIGAVREVGYKASGMKQYA